MKDPRQNPSCYRYALTDVDGKDYADALESVFRDPTFMQKMKSRDNLYDSLKRMPTKLRVDMAFKQLERMDQSLASIILQALVMRSLQSKHYDSNVTFNSLLNKVDLTDEKMKKAHDRLTFSLDTLTFLTDVLESKIVDINSDLNTLFGDVEFKQFNGVQAALRNMSAFFQATRDDGTQEEVELFANYAASIEDYLDKRMRTWKAKWLAIKNKQQKK